MSDKDHQEIIQKVAAFLRTEGRGSIAPGLLRALERVEKKEIRLRTSEVIIAKDADRKNAQQFAEETLKKEYGDHSEWILSFIVDDALVGGWIVRTPTLEVDRSYRRELLKLYERLKAIPLKS